MPKIGLLLSMKNCTQRQGVKCPWTVAVSCTSPSSLHQPKIQLLYSVPFILTPSDPPVSNIFPLGIVMHPPYCRQ